MRPVKDDFKDSERRRRRRRGRKLEAEREMKDGSTQLRETRKVTFFKVKLCILVE